MQWITVATPPFNSIEDFDKVTAEFGAPEGMEARYVGKSDGELRVVSLWETKAHADRFFTTTLGPALAKVLGPEPVGQPEALGIEIQRTFVRS